jgi:single-stranded-DNA-specific exonuclease
MKFRWSVMPSQPLLAGQLAQHLRISPLLAQCLLNRGITDEDLIGRFLEPRLKLLADPFLLPNMELAVDRLFLARERKESIAIFGDYDVDGVTSTALLMEVLNSLGWKADYYLPHRMDDGYGLTEEGLDNCFKKIPANVLVAVDCGSSAAGPIRQIQERGIDVVVLDHHQISNPPPDALALVNPNLSAKRSGAGATEMEPKDFRELCSVGLAFKLAHALLKRGRERGMAGAAEYDLRPLLDLVALGTIADIVPLTGENRILTSAGLSRLNSTSRPGLVALKQVAKCPAKLGVHEVEFQLAPRLNASGRLESAEEALRLLLARDSSEAMPLAQKIDARNRERQTIERTISEQAISTVQARFKPETDFVIVEGQAPWHIGVVGIVAARVLRHFYRPTIIVGADGDHWRGSGRSVPGFDLAAALRQCSHLLVRHGGHAMAAGLTIQMENLDFLRAELNELVKSAFRLEQLQPSLRIDAEVGLDEMTMQSLAALQKLKPTGQGNPVVNLMARNVIHHRPLQRVGADKQHVKMWVTDGTSTHETVWWRAGQESLPVGKFDLAFVPEVNHYNGKTAVQLRMLDWRAAAL